MADTSIDRLTLDIVVNNDNATRRINSVTKAIEKLNTAVSKSGNLDKVLGTLNNVSPTRASSGGGGGSSKSSSGGMRNLNIFSTLGKWNYYINMARYYGRALADTVQYAMDYVETQNLWQVANRQNIALASEFIDKMNKAYGISEQTLMNHQAIFKNMLSALGEISDAVSTTLSQQLMQLALDFSSLYNVSIASSMQKFQAVLSGQVRPIRSVSGYDITENTIYSIYKNMGGEKAMRQLSQLEKRLLRIYAVFQQMESTGATGDLAKTIESASNQARIMTEQFKEVQTWTGMILLQGMESIGLLKYVNATLMTIKEVIKSIAFDGGYMTEDWSIDSIFEDANEQVDELQGKLLSFDKFEALNPASDNILGIDPKIEQLISSISLKMNDYEMEASKISKRWLEQIGFGKEMYRILDQNGKVIEMTVDEYNALDEATKSTFKSVENYRVISEDVKKTLDSFRKLGISMVEIFGSLMETIKPLVDILVPAIGWVAEKLAVAYGWLAKHKLILSWLLSSFLAPLNIMGKIVEKIGFWIEVIKNSLTTIGYGIKNIFKNFVGGKMIAPAYATGGFPEDGMFYANSGELVGQFSNGKTAVANNEQIVQGITQGVYTAMMAYNAQTSRQNGSGDVYLDGTKVGKVVAKSSHKEMVRTGLVSVNA